MNSVGTFSLYTVRYFHIFVIIVELCMFTTKNNDFAAQNECINGSFHPGSALSHKTGGGLSKVICTLQAIKVG